MFYQDTACIASEAAARKAITAFPGRRGISDQSEIDLVYQRRSLQGVVATLLMHLLAREAAKFLVDRWQQSAVAEASPFSIAEREFW